ncbi:MAG: hypothetical protein KC561_00630, partial [Myxococcales bacterium]|nr:hypothetical protein [Myxococcales bacterium]
TQFSVETEINPAIGYTIVVTNHGSQCTTYDLRVQTPSSCRPDALESVGGNDTSSAILVGRSAAVEATSCSDDDWYLLPVCEGGALSFSVKAESAVAVRMFDRDGSVVGSTSSINGNTVEGELEAAQEELVYIGVLGQNSGDYTLTTNVAGCVAPYPASNPVIESEGIYTDFVAETDSSVEHTISVPAACRLQAEVVFDLPYPADDLPELEFFDGQGQPLVEAVTASQWGTHSGYLLDWTSEASDDVVLRITNNSPTVRAVHQINVRDFECGCSVASDQLESNDAHSEATFLTVPNGYSNLTLDGDDHDWFGVPLCAGGQLAVSYPNGSGPLAYRLYHGSGLMVVGEGNLASAETVEWPAGDGVVETPHDELVFVELWSPDNTMCIDYQVHFSTTCPNSDDEAEGAPPGNDSRPDAPTISTDDLYFPDLRVLDASSVDFYRTEVCHGGSYEVTAGVFDNNITSLTLKLFEDGVAEPVTIQSGNTATVSYEVPVENGDATLYIEVVGPPGLTTNYWMYHEASNCGLDADRDGVRDDYEDELGTSTGSVDSDSDGLTDAEEIFIYRTNPNEEDSDDDLLTDYEEITDYLTDPNEYDTDAGGLSDYQELVAYSSWGRDPHDGADDLVFEVVTGNLPEATRDQAYFFDFADYEPVGGDGEFHYVPSTTVAGLSFDSSGTVSGVPTSAGTFPLVFSMDSGTASQEFEFLLEVVAPLSLSAARQAELEADESCFFLIEPDDAVVLTRLGTSGPASGGSFDFNDWLENGYGERTFSVVHHTDSDEVATIDAAGIVTIPAEVDRTYRGPASFGLTASDDSGSVEVSVVVNYPTDSSVRFLRDGSVETDYFRIGNGEEVYGSLEISGLPEPFCPTGNYTVPSTLLPTYLESCGACGGNGCVLAEGAPMCEASAATCGNACAAGEVCTDGGSCVTPYFTIGQSQQSGDVYTLPFNLAGDQLISEPAHSTCVFAPVRYSVAIGEPSGSCATTTNVETYRAQTLFVINPDELVGTVVDNL